MTLLIPLPLMRKRIEITERNPALRQVHRTELSNLDPDVTAKTQCGAHTTVAQLREK